MDTVRQGDVGSAGLPSAVDRFRFAAQRWADHRKRDLLVLTGPINSRAFLEVYRLLGKGPKRNLDVFLDSPGGDPHAAFQIANCVRQHATGADGVVVFWAKSAATLLALGFDELIISETGQLGPLDTQVKVRSDRDRGRYQSALEVVRAMRERESSALRLWRLSADTLMNEENLNVRGAYELASTFVGHAMDVHFSPIQLDQFGESVRHLEVAQNYAKTLLVRHRGFDEDAADWIARRLVESYPSHSCVLDAVELGRLGLQARLPKDDEIKLLDDLRDCFMVMALDSDDHPTLLEVFTSKDSASEAEFKSGHGGARSDLDLMSASENGRLAAPQEPAR